LSDVVQHFQPLRDSDVCCAQMLYAAVVAGKDLDAMAACAMSLYQGSECSVPSDDVFAV
jgi:hypothetical protein